MKSDWLQVASLILVAMWLGAALLVSGAVAPAAFQVLPSRALAGAVVGRVLPVVFVSGIAIAAVVAFGVGRTSWKRWVAPSVVALTCGIAQFGIGARIARLRADIGVAVDSLPVDDPQRLLFGQLHSISVALLGAAFLAAGTILITLTLAMRQRLHGAR
jgi:hypothetical protein